MATKTERLSRSASLLALIDEVEADDLAAIDAEIKTASDKLDGLNAVRKIIAKRLGLEEPKQPRKSPVRKSGGGAAIADKPSKPAPTREKVLAYIHKHGPDTISILTHKLDMTYQQIHSAVTNNAWFDKQGANIHLTTAGQQAAKDLELKDDLDDETDD